MPHTDALHKPGTRAAVPASPRRTGVLRDVHTVHVLWRREMIRFLRNRLRIATGLVMPLLFLLILGSGLNSVLDSPGSGQSSASGAGDFRTYLFPGVLLMVVQGPAMTAGALIVWDRQAGFLRQMLVAPVRRGALLGGICLGGATTGAAYTLPMLVMAGVVGVPYGLHLLLALGILGLVAFSFTVLGVLGAVCIRRPETFDIVMGLCAMPLLFLSGALFPVHQLPGWLNAAVLVNPLTYGVDALRRTLPGGTGLAGVDAGPQWWGWTPPVALELSFIALLALGALAVAGRRFARTD
ncbi:ABC transporter [Streptomyces sp. A244]|uniref:ABC transporter permease n=1 Tax=Streptomyces sp. A244 TaxID=2137016 RepID=UPI000D1A06A3|nr:ABC transporter permease [Streptomyces sp. A244]PTH90239.1 ABC transporter [Streptomyces sp. A244]